MYLCDDYNEKQVLENNLGLQNTLMLMFKNTTIPYVIFGMNPDLVPIYIIDVNAAFCSRLGYSKDELLSKKPNELFTGTDIVKNMPEAVKATAGNSAVEILDLKGKDGRRILFEMHRYIPSKNTNHICIAIAIELPVHEKRSEICQYLKVNRQSDGLLSDRNTIKGELELALKKKEFLLYYQPKIKTYNNRICGAEALIRWKHMEQGILSPMNFIPVAEETGLIIPIGEWVLYNACKQNLEWFSKGYMPLSIAINISAIQLQHNDFFNTILRVLRDTKINPHYVEFEITESAIINNLNSSHEILKDLRKMGIRIALDDFGTGYSSLSYLRDLNIDSLKIDRSFVKDIMTDRKKRAIVRGIIEMAHSLGLKVIAEGVEEISQQKILKYYKCDYIQGYLISKPLPSWEYEALIINK